MKRKAEEVDNEVTRPLKKACTPWQQYFKNFSKEHGINNNNFGSVMFGLILIMYIKSQLENVKMLLLSHRRQVLPINSSQSQQRKHWRVKVLQQSSGWQELKWRNAQTRLAREFSSWCVTLINVYFACTPPKLRTSLAPVVGNLEPSASRCSRKPRTFCQ